MSDLVWTLGLAAFLIAVSLVRRTAEVDNEIYYRSTHSRRKILSPSYQRRLDDRTERYLKQIDWSCTDERPTD